MGAWQYSGLTYSSHTQSTEKESSTITLEWRAGGAHAPWCSYPVLPPSAAGSSPSRPAHPAASALHPQHCVSQSSCLEMSRVDPPVPRTQGKSTESFNRKYQTKRFYINCAASGLATRVLLPHIEAQHNKKVPSPIKCYRWGGRARITGSHGPKLSHTGYSAFTYVPISHSSSRASLWLHHRQERDTFRLEINQNQPDHSILFWSPKLCNSALKLDFWVGEMASWVKASVCSQAWRTWARLPEPT